LGRYLIMFEDCRSSGKCFIDIREAQPYQNGWIFGKVPNGGGSFPFQKFLLQILDFWTGFFWHKNDTKGYFQGMFFQQFKEKFKKETEKRMNFRKSSKRPLTPPIDYWLLSKSLNVLKVLGPTNPRIWSWDFVFDSRDHYFWYSRTQGFSKIYHIYGF